MPTVLELLQEIAANTANYHCHRYRRTPVEAPDGENVAFTLPDGDAYESGTLAVRVDGLALDADGDVAENGPGNTDFALAAPPAPGAVLKIDYVLKRTQEGG